MQHAQVVAAMRKEADPARAAHNRTFFKTGPGQYGHGDQFWGLTVPQLRRLAGGWLNLSFGDLERLLASAIHEQRLLALLILRRQYEAGGLVDQETVYRFYIDHLSRVNNWDLVDGSAPYIVGAYLQGRSRRPLYRWVESANLWERRVAMVATWWFIRAGDFNDALAIAEKLLGDSEDLMHKAVGWMLREIDKRDHAVAVHFLQTHYCATARTTLRYAMERFPLAERQAGMQGRFDGKAARADGKASRRMGDRKR